MPCPGSWAVQFVAEEVEPQRPALLHNEQICLSARLLRILLPGEHFVGLGGQDQTAKVAFQKGAGDGLPAPGGFAGTGASENLDSLKGILQVPVVFALFVLRVVAEIEQLLVIVRPVLHGWHDGAAGSWLAGS